MSNADLLNKIIDDKIVKDFKIYYWSYLSHWYNMPKCEPVVAKTNEDWYSYVVLPR